MAQFFSRLLDNQNHVDHFIKEVLGVDDKKLKNIPYSIIQCEQGMAPSWNGQTWDKDIFRDRKYFVEDTRQRLREQIIEELYNFPLLQNDDNIKLRKGGARPPELVNNKVAYIIIGLPASGKSSVSMRVALNKGAMVIDSDFAKRKLPEFSKYQWGASVVHVESTRIIFGEMSGTSAPLLERAISSSNNVVIPKIGNNYNDIVELAQFLKSCGYIVHLSLVSLQKKEATIRALYRFHETNRYVPLSMIFDQFGNDPCLTYYMLKNKQMSCFDSFGAIYTKVERGQDFLCIDKTSTDNPADLYPENYTILI